MASAGYAALPFYLAGGLKIVYDLLMYREFRAVKPPEEQAAGTADGERQRSSGQARARRGLIIRNQIQATTTTTRTAITAYSKRLSQAPTVSQFAPSCTPAKTSSAVHGREPRNVKTVNLPRGICAMPAANDTRDRITADHPTEEAGGLAVPGEEVVRLVEVRRGDADVPTPSLQERTAAPGADPVRDERADRRSEGAGQHRQPEVPGAAGDGLERRPFADEEPREREDELGRDRDDDALEGDPERDAEIADGFVDLGDQFADRSVQEVEHGREHSRLSSDEVSEPEVPHFTPDRGGRITGRVASS